MTLEAVDIHTDQTNKTGKVLGRVEQLLDSEGRKSGHSAVEIDSKDVQKTRRTHYPEEKVPCDTCHAPFIPNRPWQRFCSTPCRRQYHRTETRDAILAGMVATAKALGYTKVGFISKIDTVWK